MSIQKITIFFSILIISFIGKAQTNPKLIKADKLFIKMAYVDAAEEYENYLKKSPKDFYTSKQLALCYTKINNHNKAIDYWPTVVDNAQASENDKLMYGKCLLANYRFDDAKKIFIDLKNSSNKEIAAWGNAYNNLLFYEDSSLTKVTEIKNINTNSPQFSPRFWSNKFIYLDEQKPNPFVRLFSAWTGETFYVYKVSDKTDSITFGKSTKYNKHIQSKKMNGPMSISSNDSIIYFTKSASKKDAKKIKNAVIRLQLFTSKFNKFGDVHPEILPFQYNSLDYDCMHPALNKAGNKLYFVSNMPGGQGGFDIWVCDKQNETWSKPVNLGPKINSSGNEVFPFIADDGGLYYSSDNKPGLGGLDIFYADYNKFKKEFSEPENFGANFNTQFDDFGVLINKNLKSGYLSSNKKNGLRDDDIYYFNNNKPRYFDSKLKFVDSVSGAPIAINFTFTQGANKFEEKLDSGKTYDFRLKAGKDFSLTAFNERYKPIDLIKKVSDQDTVITITCSLKSEKSIKGKVIDKETNLPLAGVKVAIYDEFGNNYLNIVTDSTGDYKAVNLPLNKPLFIGSEKRPDYFSNTEKFVIKPDSDILKNIYTQKIVVGKSIKVENIYFDVAKWNIKADAALELDKLVQLMKDNPDIIIELSSHTDCRGKASANLALSDKRAKSSASYIVSKGITKTRIKGKGYGESKLLNNCACEGKVNSTCSEDVHAQNRRTEIKVVGFVKNK
jgi:outer membrane protein OmpA-like peptidoglycan-associated protein